MMERKPAGQGSSHGQLPDLVLKHASLGYGSAVAVQDVDGQFESGSMTAIIGPNGSGKSTLLKGLLGLSRPLRGSIESRHPRAALGYLAQGSDVEPQFPISVEDYVAVGLWSRIGSLRAVSRALMQQVREAIAAVGLQGHASRLVGELSGGQMQRLRFARLLAQNPPVIMLDEPFSGIDEPTTKALLQLMHVWHARGKTVIAVLHDREMVRAHFPRTLALDGRVVAWDDTGRVLGRLQPVKVHA